MALEFNQLYLVTTPPGDLRSLDIALGVRVGKPQENRFGAPKPAFPFRWISTVLDEPGPGHPIEAFVLRESAGIIDLHQVFRGWSEAAPTVLRFEVLTLKRFRDLVKNGWLRNLWKQARRLDNDAALVNYFFSAYLPDSWESDPAS